jgi:radical SAM superfamily enzyme YgiQ (UPF0313 family)
LLTSILREKGIEVFVVELHYLTDIKKIIKENKIDFVGFSIVSSPEYNECLPFMIEVKKMGIPVLVGGVYVRRGSYIDPDAADYICRGEGEILADFILDGKTEIFDKPYFHENLDNLPLPDYERLTGYEFDREVPFLKGLKIIPYSASRGCPYQCSFCESQFQPRKIRFKSTIREDMDLLAERFNPNLFHIMTEQLPYFDNEWCNLFNGNRHLFMAYIRADIIQDQLEFLFANGLKVALFGIESGDEKYRNEILKKNLLDEDIYRTVGMMRALNIYYIPFYMVNGPYETNEIRGKTVGMARGLGGFPVFWQYEDLSKRIFNIDDEKIKKYTQKVKGEFNLTKSIFNDSSNYVYSENGGFIVYRFVSDHMFIHDFNGSGKRWQDKIEELCKEHGIHKYFGRMNNEYRGFQKKYNLAHYGHLIGGEV